MQTISAADPLVRLTGRVDVRDTGASFYWPASFAEVRFQGTQISCRVSAHVVYGFNALGVIIDGLLTKVPIFAAQNDTEQEILLAQGLEMDRTHTLTLYKMQDGASFYTLFSFACDGAFLPPPAREPLRLEFYGDSVTSGCCVEPEDFTARLDPCSANGCFDNPWWSYAWQCGRLLHAEVHTVSQGGIAVRSGTGYYHYPDGIGMDHCWDKLCYIPEAGPDTAWDFARFQPHAVVLALGQNDPHDIRRGDDSISLKDPQVRDAWKEAYKRIARGIAGKYQKGTPLVFITTVLMHDREWDDAIGEVAAELKQEGLNAEQFLFRRAGRGTPGHPRIGEQREMALELAEKLRDLLPRELV